MSAKRGMRFYLPIVIGITLALMMAAGIRAVAERNGATTDILIMAGSLLLFSLLALSYIGHDIKVLPGAVRHRAWLFSATKEIEFAKIVAIDVPETFGTIGPGMHNLRLTTRDGTEILSTGLFSNRRQLIRLIIERARVENPAVVVDPLLLVQR